MRKAAKALFHRLGLGRPADQLYAGSVRNYRKLRRALGSDRRAVKRYLAHHDCKKLHIGCGQTPIPGWLNTDYFPTVKGVLRLDATQPFPFQDNTFDFIFSEHMIEHVPYDKGLFMLRECFRVLRVGGVIRLSTPNLEFLISLYNEGRSDLESSYIDWAMEGFNLDKNSPVSRPALVVNNFVRAWGHMFIYDDKTLSASMARAGFVEIARCELNASTHSGLQNLEHEQRLPPGFLKLETMTIEGTKR